MLRSLTQRIIKKSLLFVILVVTAMVGLTGIATAHVNVKPSEVVTGSFENFSVGAPNERQVGFTSLRLEIPANLQHVSPNVKAGWTVEVETDGEGEDAPVKAITWFGGMVPKGFREDFGFSARTPDNAGELQWKSTQTYEDGEIVSWTLKEGEKPKQGGGSPEMASTGPFSITKVVKESAEARAIGAAEAANATTARQADRAIYLGVAGLLLGLAALFIASRKPVK
jgi:uncharacterized protein YcnI